jgi:hypothetical protein
MDEPGDDTDAAITTNVARVRAAAFLDAAKRDPAFATCVFPAMEVGVTELLTHRNRGFGSTKNDIKDASEAWRLLQWWFDAPLATNKDVTAAAENMVKWGTNVLWRRYWMNTLLAPDKSGNVLEYGESLTKPTLQAVELRADSPLAALTDFSRRIMIKSQRVDVTALKDSVVDVAMRNRKYAFDDAAALAFTVDVLASYFLRRLTTNWAYQVTPHFATLLDAFAAPAASGGADVALYSFAERADVELGDYLFDAAKSAPWRDLTQREFDVHLGALLFQALYSSESAFRLMGMTHGDFHPGNIMLRDVRGTPYANRPWVYARAAEPGGYYVIPPEAHRNMMVEIIDFGRAAFQQQWTPEAEKPLLRDWKRILLHTFVTDNPELFSALANADDVHVELPPNAAAAVPATLRDRIVHYIQSWWQQRPAANALLSLWTMASRFPDTLTMSDDARLGFLNTGWPVVIGADAFYTTRRGGDDRRLLSVAKQPVESVVKKPRTTDVIGRPYFPAYGTPEQRGMKRPRNAMFQSSVCLVCGERAALVEQSAARRTYCTLHCQAVHYGHIDASLHFYL